MPFLPLDKITCAKCGTEYTKQDISCPKCLGDWSKQYKEMKEKHKALKEMNK